ncbi:restriction endonuclease subunit S [Thiomicrorhabdus hydrogeniphila]
MSNDWNTKPLGELAENISRRFDFSNKEKVIFINTGDVLEGNFLHREYSESSTLPGQAKKAIKKGDILYSEIRPGNKRYVLIDFDADDYVVSTKFMVIKAKEKILPEYLYLILTSQECEQEFKLIADSRSGTFPQITFDSVTYYPIKYPVKEEQQRLVNIAGSITGKIELNRQTNQTLEQIAQALFKSWFVDFDPVKAKIAAKQAGGTAEQIERAAMAAISGKTEEELDKLTLEQYTNLKTTAALFPETMKDSELGEIPEGWEVKSFGNYLDTISKTYPLKGTNEVVFLNTGDIQDGKFLHENYSSSESLPGQAKKSIQKHDILYSEIRPINRRFAYVTFDADDYVVSTKLMVLRSNGKIPSEVLYFLLTRQSVLDELQIVAESRSGTFPQIRFENISKTEFIGPEDNKLFAFFNQNLLLNNFELQNTNNSESKELVAVRDALLPKLLSNNIIRKVCA